MTDDDEQRAARVARPRGVIEWWFADRRPGHDGLVVGQPPNPPALVMIAALAVRGGLALTRYRDAPVTLAAEAVFGAAFAFWSIDEIVRGVNPWRRLLGVGSLVVLAAGAALRAGRLA